MSLGTSIRRVRYKFERFSKKLKFAGFLATSRYVAWRAYRGVYEVLSPAACRAREEQILRDKEFAAKRQNVDESFDKRHNLDTGGAAALDDLGIVGENKDYGNGFQSVFPDRFREPLESLRLDLTQFSFIDFGSGKGRAVLLAAEYPFQKVIGVEFARELHLIAEANWHKYKQQPVVRCQGAEWHCMDAALFPLPTTPLILYLYNPFGREVMSRLVDKVFASLRADPRPIYVVYLAPKCADLWEQRPGTVTVWTGEHGKAYRLGMQGNG